MLHIYTYLFIYLYMGWLIHQCMYLLPYQQMHLYLLNLHIFDICQYSRLFKCFVSVNQSINSSLYNPPIRSIAGSRGLVNELRESPWSVGLRSCASKGFFISTAWEMRPVENRLETKIRFLFFWPRGSFFGGWGNHCPLESDDAKL